MNREEARLVLQAHVIFACEEAKFSKETIKMVEDALDMAIEALSQPNYETDTEVRLAVTNRKKEKVIFLKT